MLAVWQKGFAMINLYNCDNLAELLTLRRDPRGTREVDTSELTFKTTIDDITGEDRDTAMLEWNGYHVYVLAIDGNTAEIFIP